MSADSKVHCSCSLPHLGHLWPDHVCCCLCHKTKRALLQTVWACRSLRLMPSRTTRFCLRQFCIPLSLFMTVVYLCLRIFLYLWQLFVFVFRLCLCPLSFVFCLCLLSFVFGICIPLSLSLLVTIVYLWQLHTFVFVFVDDSCIQLNLEGTFDFWLVFSFASCVCVCGSIFPGYQS